MNLAEIFPDLAEKIEIWKKNVTENSYYTSNEAQIIIENFYLIGPSFIHESRNQRKEYKHKIKISLFAPGSFYVIRSKKYYAKTSITFDMVDYRPLVILRNIQGTVAGEEKCEVSAFNLFLNDIADIAKNSEYSGVRLLRPEFTTHYYEPESTLKEIWSKANPEEALKRLPTVFDLHETELHHQERMKKLYYTIAKRSGFEKKGKYFEYNLDG